MAPHTSPPEQCDVLIVGGGVNGAGIARDLAGRGQGVVLCEKDDLASHTSGASTKLIHGGLRYLEYYEFAMVRKSLLERERLLRGAPHIMWPLRFVMPHNPSMRPAWMIRAGLLLYDHLARREILPGSHAMDLRGNAIGAPLKKAFTRAFVYSDGWVDDARLVVLSAMDAAARGAHILTRHACVDAQREAASWRVTLRSELGTSHVVHARALVNAAGPWAAQFLAEQAHQPHPRSLRLVKGSHIVVPKLFDHDHAYIFQNPDKRIIFGIPFLGRFTLIGTTDVEHRGEVGQARIDDDEIAYLCEQASRYFEHAVRPADVVWSYAGVRPLLDDGSGDAAGVTRDYLLDLDTTAAPLLTVWGGKITAFRKLAEEVADLLAGALGMKSGAWTETAFLPGGDLSAWIGAAQRPDTDFERFVLALQQGHAWLPPALARRLARAYGAHVGRVLGTAAALADLGAEVAPGLFEAELRYLHDHEWARSAGDVLWRRSKLGLFHTPAQHRAVAAWCRANWDDALADSADETTTPTRGAWRREPAWN
jgi:glycerol-3-phosphate dehydrogenase